MRFMNRIKGFYFLFFYWSRVEEKEGCGDGKVWAMGPTGLPSKNPRQREKERGPRRGGGGSAFNNNNNNNNVNLEKLYMVIRKIRSKRPETSGRTRWIKRNHLSTLWSQIIGDTFLLLLVGLGVFLTTALPFALRSAGGIMEGAVSEKQASSSYTYWVREAREDAAPLPVPRKLTQDDLLSQQSHTSALGSVWNKVRLLGFRSLYPQFPPTLSRISSWFIHAFLLANAVPLPSMHVHIVLHSVIHLMI